MRLTMIFLAGLGVLFLVLAAVVPGRQAAVARGSVEAPGIVTGLADGPYHALVRFASPEGDITFPANVAAGLSPGQQVVVRYLPGQARETAHVVTPAGSSGTGGRALLVVGLACLLAAAASPILVRAFPGLLASRIRP